MSTDYAPYLITIGIIISPIIPFVGYRIAQNIGSLFYRGENQK